MLTIGDPAPWFVAPSPGNPAFDFSSAAGRRVVLSFPGSGGDPAVRDMLARIASRRDLFDDVGAAFFAVSNDAEDLKQGRLRESLPGLHLFWDFQGGIAERYGLLRRGAAAGQAMLNRVTLLLDARLRVQAVLPIADPTDHADDIIRAVERLAPPIAMPAPVLLVPRVFEPEFCRDLIALYQRDGGKDSGFMRTDPVTGKTIGMIDHRQKRRRDCEIQDEALRAAIRGRIERRLVPELRRGFQFAATRVERYIVACYDAGEGGYFRPHRDNTTKGTAHRRFAVTLNLNAEEYEGGDLRFPEFGAATYRAPTGGAVVFSCSLLHEATPVTSGRRYCVLPFLYDDAAAALRERNLPHVE